MKRLKKLQIRHEYNYGGYDNVKNLREAAMKQMKEYMIIAKNRKELEGRVLIGFSALQIGFDRFLIEKTIL